MFCAEPIEVQAKDNGEQRRAYSLLHDDSFFLTLVSRRRGPDHNNSFEAFTDVAPQKRLPGTIETSRVSSRPHSR
jgi:hypothetical protein